MSVHVVKMRHAKLQVIVPGWSFSRSLPPWFGRVEIAKSSFGPTASTAEFGQFARRDVQTFMKFEVTKRYHAKAYRFRVSCGGMQMIECPILIESFDRCADKAAIGLPVPMSVFGIKQVARGSFAQTIRCKLFGYVLMKTCYLLA